MSQPSDPGAGIHTMPVMNIRYFLLVFKCSFTKNHAGWSEVRQAFRLERSVPDCFNPGKRGQFRKPDLRFRNKASPAD